MKTRDITTIAIMITIMIVLGLFPPIPVGILPIPIVIQNASFMLAGLILGKKRGTIATVLFLILVALGFPFLAGGRGGISVFFGATVGYLLAYPVATFLIGWATESFNPSNKKMWLSFVITFFLGVLFIDICGAIGFSVQSDLTMLDSLFANLIYIPGDTIKALLCALLAPRLTKILSRGT